KPTGGRSKRTPPATLPRSLGAHVAPTRWQTAGGAPTSAGELVPPWSIHVRGSGGKVEQVARATALSAADLSQKRPQARAGCTRHDGSWPLRPHGRQRQFGTTTPRPFPVFYGNTRGRDVQARPAAAECRMCSSRLASR